MPLPDFSTLEPVGQSSQLPDFDSLTPVETPPSGLETFGEHAATGIGPGAAFALAAPRGARIGALAGAAIPGLGETGIPEAVGAFIGGLVSGGIASWGAYKAQHAALNAVAPKFTAEMDRRLQAGQESHPFIAVAGDVAGNLPSMELSIPTLKQLPFRAALGGTVGAVLPLTQGRLPNKEDVASGAAMAALFGRSRFEPKESAAIGKVPLSDIPETEQEALPIEGDESKTPIEEEIPSEEMATTVAKSDLDDEHQFMLDEAAKSQGADVHVVDPSELPDDQPFARLKNSLSKAISTIDRRDNRILINPVELKNWLSKIPEDRHQDAIHSLINEEKIHLGVDDDAAKSYWDSLTGLEKSIAKKRYSGDWSGRNFSDLTDTDWGHEALRFRLQQLSRMTPREIADSVGTEHWTFRSITALESLIRGLRNTFGKGDTKAIVDRMAANLNIAKAAIINSSMPAARQRGGYQAKDYSPEDLKLYQDLNSKFVNLSENEAGSPEHLAVWKQFEDLRNKYGGMPPKQLAPKVDLQAATQAEADALNEAAAQYEALGATDDAAEMRQMAKDIAAKGSEQFFPAARRRPSAVRPLTEQEKAALKASPPPTPQQEENLKRQIASIKSLPVKQPELPESILPRTYEGEGEITAPKGSRGEYKKPLLDKSTIPFLKSKSYWSEAEQEPTVDFGTKDPSQLFMPSLTGTALEGKASEWLRGEMDKVAAAGKSGKTVSLPRYKDFIDRLRKATGGRMQEGAMFDTWQKLVNDELQKASGDTLTSMYRSELGKRIRKSGGVPIRKISKVADSAKPPSEQEFKLEMLKAGESTKEVSTRARQDAQYARSAQNRRQRVIGYLFGRMIRRPITDIKTSLERTAITPEDIRYGGANRYEGEHTAAFQAFSPDAEKTPNTLGMKLTDESGVSGDLPETVTRRVTAIQNRRGEDVHLVSTYDDNGVARLLDPASGSAKIHSALPSILRRYRVLYSVLLDQPVQRFHERFSSPAEFMEKFGKEAAERQAASMSYEAPPTQQFLEQTEGSGGIQGEGGDFMGPERDIISDQGESAIEEARRSAMTPDEARALFDLAVSKQKSGKLSIDEVLEGIKSLRTKPNRQATAALVKMSEDIEKANPNADMSQLLRVAASRILQAHEEAANMDEFTKLLGVTGEKVEEPVATESGTEITIPYTVKDAKLIEKRFKTKQRLGLINPEDLFPSNPAARTRFKAAQAAKDNAIDELEKRRAQLSSSWLRRATRMTIRQNADGMDQDAMVTGERVKNALKLVSDNEQIRMAPMVMIAAQKVGKNPKNGFEFYYFDKATVEEKLSQAKLGAAKAEEFLRSEHARDRRLGRAWLKAANQLQANAQFVLDNWGKDSPQWKKILDMTKAVRTELKGQIDRENANGVGTNFREGYFPGRYDSEFFNGDAIAFGENRTLGRRFSARKRFKDAFEAIARGPYIPKTYDAADLVSHRVRQGMQAINRPAWGEMLKTITDPISGKKIAVNAVPKNPRQLVDADTGESVFHAGGWEPPSAEYELMNIRNNADPVAVLKPYKSVVSACMAQSGIENWPTGRAALAASTMLKHGVVLLFDTFHPMRLGQYAISLMRTGKGYKGFLGKAGTSALLYRPEDLQQAVKQGLVSKEAAAWATQKIHVNMNGISKAMSRQQILETMVKKGLNAAKIADALHRDAVKSIPLLGNFLYYKAGLGKFNDMIFGKFLPGLISESAVRNFERLHTKNPNINFDRMMRDVVTDMNAYYGNMGRQGIFLNPTFRDLAQITLLAPMWQEGLLQKEIRFYSRLSGASGLMGRKGLPRLGALGQGMATGLAAYFVITQLINLVSRGHLTFQNKERGHELDAWLPVGNEGNGFWMSPMSVFAESTHDLIRLAYSKPKIWDAIMQFGENKLGPMGRMAYTLETGKDSSGQYLTSTEAVIRSALGQLAPIPISLGKPVQAAAHALFPNQVPPTEPGALGRQLVATGLGIKLEPAQRPEAQIQGMASRFLTDSGLRPETINIQYTDQPSYAQMRHAIDIGDEAGAKRILQRIEKTHTESQIITAMNNWARRPFTGSDKAETLFIDSLSDADKELYTEANVRRMDLLNKWAQWYSAQ